MVGRLSHASRRILTQPSALGVFHRTPYGNFKLALFRDRVVSTVSFRLCVWRFLGIPQEHMHSFLELGVSPLRLSFRFSLLLRLN